MTDAVEGPGYTLGELAQRLQLQLQGDAQLRIAGVCSLDPGKPGCLSFCVNARLYPQLANSAAAAVVIGLRDGQKFSGNALLAKDPALAFARITALFDSSRQFTPAMHPSAVVEPGAEIGAGCWIGPQAVIEAGARIGENSFIGPHCLIGRNAFVGPGSRLEARVHVGRGCRLGARAQVNPGAVIGSRGFGLARSPEGWVEVPQLGVVSIGDDVEIGANTCIDRGALDDTVIGNGVKLDNLIQIAHNCRIGSHTAIAACVGIAGSTVIGSRCLIGGAAVINGHIQIVDDVVILGKSMVTKSLTEPGVYGSGLPVQPAREWRREVARIHRLPQVEQRLKQIENKLQMQGRPGEASEPDDT
jgi:UDP-3-O-[3-hydroxymyristoyl] glucosamine N-acyltransferase